MNMRTLVAIFLLATLAAAPVAADHEEEPDGKEPCTIVDVTTYEPYVTPHWHCIDDLVPLP